ncbi:hypothetical protein SRO_1622 [Streptomyces rochei]|nr:hypothetical protein SRO_1622 [Streptomyces rochei]
MSARGHLGHPDGVRRPQLTTTLSEPCPNELPAGQVRPLDRSHEAGQRPRAVDLDGEREERTMHIVQFIDQHGAEIVFVLRTSVSVWRAVRRARRAMASQPRRAPQGERAGRRSVK